MLKIRIVRFPESIANELTTTSVKLEGQEISIGRSTNCSLILPDPNRLVSREHCVITPVGDQWLLMVKSTSNQVVIGSQELDFGQSKVLNDGDFIIICEFALQVEEEVDYSSTQSFVLPLAQPDIMSASEVVAGPFDDIFFEESKGSNLVVGANPFADEFDDFPVLRPPHPVDFGDIPPVGLGSSDVVMGVVAQLPASNGPFDSISGPDVLGLNLSFGQSTVDPYAIELSPTSGINSISPIHERMPDPYHNNVPLPNSLFPKGNDVLPKYSAPKNAKVISESVPALQPTALRQILLDGLNMDSGRLTGISDEELVKRLSVLLRESLGVIVKLLQLRTDLKQEVGVERTSMNPNVNNPIKFSPNVDVALAYVLGERMPGFLNYDQAIQEAVADIINHDSILLNAGQSACKDLLRQLSPAGIEAEIEQSGGLSMKLPLQKDAKAWGRYKQVHASCTANLDIILKKAFH